MPSLNIIGAGKVARVLGRRWIESGQFEVRQILNRSLATGREAAAFMGGGEAVSGFDQFLSADAWLIGTPDDGIGEAAVRLSRCTALKQQQIAFHLSGARSSSALAPLSDRGLSVCSLHPLKTIPEPLRAYQGFDDTWCALEGDESACARLESALVAIGARSLRLKEEQKIHYHAGNAMVCNFLIALLAMGEAAYSRAGIPADQARQMLVPLMRETLDNGLQMGAGLALTGPIVRGDADVVRAHLNTLPSESRAAYREMGMRTVELARASGRLADEAAVRVMGALAEEQDQ